jgi:hypothetical protein
MSALNFARLALGLALLSGCATPRRPHPPASGERIAFLGVFAPDGTPVPLAGADAAAVDAAVRARTPGVSWVDAAALDRPLRAALAQPWPPADIWISGVLHPSPTGTPARMVWSQTTALRPHRPLVFDATYPAGLTLDAAVNSMVDGFALRAPPPEVEPAPKPAREKKIKPAKAAPVVDGPVLASVQDGRVTAAGVKPGRYFVRGAPQTFENPLTGETTVLSKGSVRGLVEIEAVEGDTATGRLVEGEAAAGDRLEPAE